MACVKICTVKIRHEAELFSGSARKCPFGQCFSERLMTVDMKIPAG